MIADSPTELLAGEYRRLTQEIEQAIGKLDEIDGAGAAVTPARTVPAMPVSRNDEVAPPHGDPLRAPSHDAGQRTLQPTPGIDPEDTRRYPPPAEEDGGGSRVLLILGAALVALLLIGWMIWRASSDRAETPPLVETAAVATETSEPVEEPAAAAITIAPAAQDYGTIRKGTRATRRFEITNNTDEPLSIQLARSTCRCLYYDYSEVIPPTAKESVTVTVDGAKAKAGPLLESIAVTSKTSAAVTGKLEVVALVR